ncbi:MAG TPA: hypothetical protein VNR40_21280, partial [Steroidobacter sp.]|nr:hypothetical protein [Steroidobacter sp.]
MADIAADRTRWRLLPQSAPVAINHICGHPSEAAARPLAQVINRQAPAYLLPNHRARYAKDVTFRSLALHFVTWRRIPAAGLTLADHDTAIQRLDTNAPVALALREAQLIARTELTAAGRLGAEAVIDIAIESFNIELGIDLAAQGEMQIAIDGFRLDAGIVAERRGQI